MKMTGDELRAIRNGLDLSAFAFGLALGYTGNRNTIQTQIRKYESGAREVPALVARLAIMFRDHGVPQDFIPQT